MKLAEVYNHNAAYWDSKLYRTAYHGAYVRLFNKLRDSNVLRPPERVLDCGIGAGMLLESFLDSGQRPSETYGVDLSWNLLRMVRSKFQGLRIEPRLTFGDISNLPYRDEEMDLVLSALVLEHVPEPQQAVREMVRVLRRTGLLIVVATRRGAPDHYFRWKYGYRPYHSEAILSWMAGAGLADARSLELAGIARLFARSYVGVKL